MIYHVLNRGNGPTACGFFTRRRAYDAFERVLSEGLGRYSVDMLTYCLMPDHWHLVVRPRTDEALGQLTGWVGVTHVRGHQEHYHRRGAGHLYQGRYKSFPVAEDDYFLMLCRYVEANPCMRNWWSGRRSGSGAGSGGASTSEPTSRCAGGPSSVPETGRDW